MSILNQRALPRLQCNRRRARMQEPKNRIEPDEKRLHPGKAGVKHLSTYFIRVYGETKTPIQRKLETPGRMPLSTVACTASAE